MMSLWPVDDDHTVRQMKAFYQNLQKTAAGRSAPTSATRDVPGTQGGISYPAAGLLGAVYFARRSDVRHRLLVAAGYDHCDRF